MEQRLFETGELFYAAAYGLNKPRREEGDSSFPGPIMQPGSLSKFTYAHLETLHCPLATITLKEQVVFLKCYLMTKWNPETGCPLLWSTARAHMPAERGLLPQNDKLNIWRQ